MKKTPFVTQNRSLAIALHLAGAEIQQVMNCYTPEQLSKWGLRNVDEAIAKGRLGAVTYFIEPHERLSQLLAAYEAQENAKDGNETEGDITPEDAIKMAFHVLKLRRDLETLIHDPRAAWLMASNGKPDPTLSQRIEEAEKKGEAISFSLPGAKFVRSDAPESTRRKLGL